MASMEALPLASQCADCVIAAFLFAHPYPALALKEMGRVVRPGGHVAVSFRFVGELPDAWESIWRDAMPSEITYSPGADLEQWEKQGEEMGLILDQVQSEGGSFHFPSHEWAWTFLTRSGYGADAFRSHQVYPSEQSLPRLANTVKAALAAVPLEQLTIPWTLHYLRWTRPA